MPESGKTVQIENSGTDSVSVGGFLGATEATHDVAEVEYINMTSCLKEEIIATGGVLIKSLKNTLETTGVAVFASILVLLASFISLLMTQLANTWALGVFISEALIIDVVIALSIIPLLVYSLKPKYVFGDKNNKANAIYKCATSG